MTAHPATSLRRIDAIALTCFGFTMNTYSASEKILFDFQAATNSAAWQVVNDDVMGGLSTSAFRVTTNGAALFTGNVSLENNGGFASVRSVPAQHDLGGCDSFVVRVRGDGRSYKFTVRMDRSLDGANYLCAFDTRKDQWEEHRFALTQFVASFRGRVIADAPPLDPKHVGSLGFMISDKQAGAFRLEIAWIKAVRMPQEQEDRKSVV